MLQYLAVFCVGMALFLDTMSYYRQMMKTIHAKRSSQVSSTAFLYKFGKVGFALVGLSIHQNWTAIIMELFMLCVYAASLLVIMRYKPKHWSLFK